MYRWQRIARIARGKGLQPKAIQWSKEISGYINDKYAPFTVQVFIEQFGNGATIHWYSDFEHLSDWESLNARLLADQGYWARLDEAADYFQEGSVQDKLVMAV